MGMFTMYWLRRFIRNNMPPVPEPKANVWNKRLSVAYALIAWNAFGFVLYSCYNGKAEWTEYHGLKTEEELKKTPGMSVKITVVKMRHIETMFKLHFGKLYCENPLLL